MFFSSISIAGMFFTTIVSLGVPVVAVLWLRRKTGHAVRAALMGLLCFVVFALVLEQIMHMLVLPFIIDKKWFYVAYGCLAAGLFEETGRLIGLKILCKKNPRVSTGAAYGIGHGGGEAILIAGVSSLANLLFAFTYSSNQTSVAMQQTAELMKNTPPYYFWIGGIERISAMLLHFALSILIWMVVTKRVSFGWYFAAIGLHAITNIAPVLLQIGVLHSVVLVEILVFLCVAATGVLVGTLYARTRANAPSLPPEEKPITDDTLFLNTTQVQPTLVGAAPTPTQEEPAAVKMLAKQEEPKV